MLSLLIYCVTKVLVLKMGDINLERRCAMRFRSRRASSPRTNENDTTNRRWIYLTQRFIKFGPMCWRMRKICAKMFSKHLQQKQNPKLRIPQKKGALTFWEQLKTIAIFWKLLLQMARLRCLSMARKRSAKAWRWYNLSRAKKKMIDQIHVDLLFAIAKESFTKSLCLKIKWLIYIF